MEPTQHAPIAPSWLARIVQCNASLVMSRPYAAQEHESAREGRAGHVVALHAALISQDMAVGATAPPMRAGTTAWRVGDVIDGIRVDKEMLAGAEMYAEALEGFGGHGETTIKIPRIHETECYGTPDFWQYSATTKRLRIADYKYGRRYVEVFENWQLIAYAVGVIDYLVESRQAVEYEIIVELLLVQPRCYHPDGPVRTWTTSATKLRPLANIAYHAAHAALGDNPTTTSGPECLFCPARANCRAAHIATTAILEYAGRAENMTQSGDEIGLRLLLIDEAITMLKAVSTGLEEQAIALLKMGKQVPHWRMGSTQPRETWAKSVEEVAMLGTLSGKQLTKLDYAMTPKQAVKLGIDRAVINQYSFTPEGKAVLTADDVTRSARIFSK